MITHSPFILSDIPHFNALFMDVDVEDPKAFGESEQIFGANIHDLLAHAFFLENGPMGALAQEKIRRVISLLNENNATQLKNNKRLAEDTMNLIQMIGEPILREKLAYDYNRIFAPERLAEIELLQNQIQNLLGK